MHFSEVIADPAQFRELMGERTPPCIALRPSLSWTGTAAPFIARSPFVLIASSNARGQMDISPKGEAPGFVSWLFSESTFPLSAAFCTPQALLAGLSIQITRQVIGRIRKQ